MFGSLSSASSGPRPNSSFEHVDDQVLALEQAERRRVRLGLDHAVDQLRISGSRLAPADLVSRSRFSRFSSS